MSKLLLNSLIESRKVLYPEEEDPVINTDTSAGSKVPSLLENSLELVSQAVIERYKVKKSPEKKSPSKKWRLEKVLGGHKGWVRSVCVEPDNTWFASGSTDSTIRVYDLVKGSLKVTLTGHIMAVRSMAVSDRHPYLFSGSEDKTIKCWDLEKNAIVRDYYGHLSAVYSVAIHPTLDVLISGSRDGSVRVWDMRTRECVHVMTGHTDNVWSVLACSVDPQIISASADSTIRLWDLAAGKTSKILTNHNKGVRCLARSPFESSFISGSTREIKKWASKQGVYIEDFEPKPASIVNTLSVNEERVVFSGEDSGTGTFWDYESGEKVQEVDMSGSVFCSSFDKSGRKLIVGEEKLVKVFRVGDV